MRTKSRVMTLRMPEKVCREVNTLSIRLGSKPSQVAVRLIEESLRRRNFPAIDLRDTANGRTAYIRGTRFAVYWIVQALERKMGDLGDAAKTWNVSENTLRQTLSYAETFRDEIESDLHTAKKNRVQLEQTETAIARLLDDSEIKNSVKSTRTPH